MNIIKLTTNNFKNARRVEIVPDQSGNLVFVAGNNGAGKSSVLDSIAAALGGVNSKTTPKPIRDGEDRAEIILETEELIVSRVFTASGSRITLTNRDGAKYPKAQAKLDELVGKLSMDPFAFTQLDAKKQLAQLLELVDLPFDPDQLEAERKALFDERTAVNRQAKELESALAQYGELPEGVPANEVSVSGLLSEYHEAQNKNEVLRRSQSFVERLQAQIEQLEEELARAKSDLTEALASVDPNAKEIDLTAIQVQIDGAEETNRLVRKAQERAALSERQASTFDHASKLTEKINKIDTEKAEMLASASFPVEGLGFDEEGVTYHGVPFKQASTAEQIRVSMAMAIALNPELRVIRITDGSLLDANSLALVEEMARENDMQVWIEVVGEGPEGAYTIVDGELANG